MDEITLLTDLFKEGGELYYVEVLKDEREMAQLLYEKGDIELNTDYEDDLFPTAKITKQGLKRIGK